MKTYWNIFKAILPHMVLIVFALFGTWLALCAVDYVWAKALPALPDGSGRTVFMLVVLLCVTCYAAAKLVEHLPSIAGFILLSLMISACIYLQNDLLNDLLHPVVPVVKAPVQQYLDDD